MLETAVVAVLSAAALYAAAGAGFALWFSALGVERVDPQSKGAPWSFRALIFPGVVAFWPMFALRLARGRSEPPVERNPHR